jgi:hypothetical protein
MRHRRGPTIAPDPRSSDDEAFNASAITALAQETRQPVEVVREIFEEQYARLDATARVRSYLVLLATRKTREELAKRSSFDRN